jgi:hypothetical protein
MTTKALFKIAVCYLCVISSSCNGGGSSAVRIENFCDRYQQIKCGAAQKCNCLGDSTMEMCKVSVITDCRSMVEEPVNAGLVVYDGEEAGLCLDGMKANMDDCILAGDQTPLSCSRMLIGTVPRGGQCQDTQECLYGLECRDYSCTEVAGEGEYCLMYGTSCAKRLYCDADSMCRPVPGVGESCYGIGECAVDLWCDDSSDYICKEFLPEGSPCTEFWQCVSMECVGGVCARDCRFF